MMMHLRIGSLLLLALGIHGAIVKRDTGPDLSGINSARKQLGEYAGVAMPALEWDEGFAKKAKTMPNDCDKLRHGTDFRVFPDAPDENAQKLVGMFYVYLLIAEAASNAPNVEDNVKASASYFIEALKKNLTNGEKEAHVLGLELLNPAQNKVGCARTKCTFKVPQQFMDAMNARGMPPELKIHSDRAVFNAICLIGPSNSWSEAKKVTEAMPKAEALKGGKISYDMASSVMASTGIISILLTSLIYVFIM